MIHIWTDSICTLTASTIDEVGGFAKMISEYGPMIVILAVFLTLFCAIITIFIKNSTDSAKSAAELNSKVLDRIMEQNDSLMDTLEKINRPEYESNIVEIFTKFNNTFRGECKDILYKTDALRVGIYVFHNGVTASHGLPFFKMTCVSEWINRDRGIQTQLRTHVNLPLNVFGDIVENLYRKGNIWIEDSEDNYTLKAFTETSKIVECVFCPVYDDYNKIMGFVCAEYSAHCPDEKKKTIILSIEGHLDRIRSVLQFSDYQGQIYK